MTKSQKVAAAVAALKVGDTVKRTHKALTVDQATLLVTEIGLVSEDNNGRTRPAFRASQPGRPGSSAYIWLVEEIV